MAYSGGVQTRPVLNRHVVALKLIEQGYSGFSGFRANFEDFTVYAVNPQDETFSCISIPPLASSPARKPSSKFLCVIISPIPSHDDAIAADASRGRLFLPPPENRSESPT